MKIQKINLIAIYFIFIGILAISSCGGGDKNDDWSPDLPPINSKEFPFADLGSGKILFESTGDTYGGLVLADADNKKITKFSLEGISAGYLISPDGKLITYYARTDLLNSNHVYGIYVCQNNGRGSKRIIKDSEHGFNPGWTPDGSKIIFWSSQNSNSIDTYTLKSIKPDGTNLSPATFEIFPNLYSTPSISSSGIMTFSTNSTLGDPQNIPGIYLYNPKNQSSQRIVPKDDSTDLNSPVFSPDGSKIAYLRVTRPDLEYKLIEVMIWDMNTSTSSILQTVNASGTQEYNFPDFLTNQVNLAWSPDGDKIIFNIPEGDFTSHLYVVNSNGTNLKKLTNGTRVTNYKVSWGR